MRASLPTPIKGWRAFAGEVGIIVLGVLIALGFGQMAEEWNWRQKRGQAVAELKSESELNFGLMAERVVVQPCIERQLDQIVRHVTSSEAVLTPLPAIDSAFGPVSFRQPVDRPFQDDVWQALNGDGTSAHLNSAGRHQMALFYWQIESMRELQKRGDVAVGRLTTLLSPMALDKTTLNSLLTTIAEARFAGRLLTLDAVQSMAMLTAAGQDPDPAMVDTNLAHSATISYCRSAGLPLANWRVRLKAEIGNFPVKVSLL